jgi:hypothetical protein
VVDLCMFGSALTETKFEMNFGLNTLIVLKMRRYRQLRRIIFPVRYAYRYVHDELQILFFSDDEGT